MYDNPPVLVDPATAAKIEIYAGPKEYEPVLKNFIGEDNLPSNYGGNLAALSPEVHPYAAYMQSVEDKKKTVVVLESKEVKVEVEEEKSEALLQSASLEQHQMDSPMRTGKRKRPGSTGLRRLMDLGSTSTVYPYPAGTPGHEGANGQYLHKLTPATEEALVATIKKGFDEKLEFLHICNGSLHPTLTVLRYLRANGFDSSKVSFDTHHGTFAIEVQRGLLYVLYDFHRRSSTCGRTFHGGRNMA